MLKLARTGNVISIDVTEEIGSLNLQNIDGAMEMARKHILQNVAAAVPMPALLLNDETMGGDFHEGTEDANAIAQWIDIIRKDLAKLYQFMDKIIQHRAWTKDFYATIQRDYPEYKDMEYEVAFYKWRNSFTAPWQEIIKEPESEQIKVEEVKLGGMFEAFDKLLPLCDPENAGTLVDWVVDNLNEMTLLFTVPLTLDSDALVKFAKQKAQDLKDQQVQAQMGHNGGPALDPEDEEDDNGASRDPAGSGGASNAKSKVVQLPQKIGAGR
jgi:hypothetical protein